MVTRQLIEKFFNRECTTEEAFSVSNYLTNHPETVREFLSEEEWEQFVTEQRLSSTKSNQLWKEIRKETRRPVIYYLKRMAAAAVIVLIAGYIWMYSSRNRTSETSEIAVPRMAFMENMSNLPLNFTLADSSVVRLMPGSSVRYPERFSGSKREIKLEGEASFTVAKDASKPFIVYSGILSTTALGTVFSVRSFEDKPTISVSLQEGKVIVKAADSNYKFFKEEFYLLPGDVFTYNKSSYTASVLNSHDQKFAAIKKSTAKELSETPRQTIEGDNWYMFNNQSLSEVFKQLEKLYNQKIDFDPAVLKGMTFIGRLDKTDSLDHILKSIAYLNNLKIAHDENGYHITR